MNPAKSTNNGMNCFNCGKLKSNIHICKIAGISQIICDDCCKKFLNEKRCQHRECGNYRII